MGLSGLERCTGALIIFRLRVTVEHVGLGRYVDPFNYDGDLKAFSELLRVLARLQPLYFC